MPEARKHRQEAEITLATKEFDVSPAAAENVAGSAAYDSVCGDPARVPFGVAYSVSCKT